MLEQVTGVVRNLFSSEQVRADVCAAAKDIGDATVAVLYEPVVGGKAVRSTASAGPPMTEAEASLERPSGVVEAFRTGRSVLITENVETHVGSVELWRAAGSPAAVLYEPLLRGAESIGVLVVGWRGEIREGAPEVTVVQLLAHEAAAVIARADALSQLNDMASTDPLTGLPNRRAWDARVNEVLAEGASFTIAMLDFDHFKDYNDTYGHPAGDRLLKETAAMWREHVRAGDLLARGTRRPGPVRGQEFRARPRLRERLAGPATGAQLQAAAGRTLLGDSLGVASAESSSPVWRLTRGPSARVVSRPARLAS